MGTTSWSEHIQIEGYECEFIPPLNLGDEEQGFWEIPWERQQRAALAWQEACAQLHSPVPADNASQMIVPSLPEPGTQPQQDHGTPRPTMRTIMAMNTLLGSLRERILQIQNEAANLAIEEMSRRHTPEADEQSGHQALPQLRPHSAARMAVLIDTWFDICTAAQTKMTRLTGFSQAPKALAPADSPIFCVERRRQLRGIDFPDRRLAG